MTPPVVGSVRMLTKGIPASCSSARAAETLAICMSERIPSCILAPPVAEMMTRGRSSEWARSMSLATFSPTTDPIEPPMN